MIWTSEKRERGNGMNESTKKRFYLTVLALLVFGTMSWQAGESTTARASTERATMKSGVQNPAPPANAADSSGVILIPHDQVLQAYAKGATLYNGNPERNYRVHIFHRDTPGEVEVHTKDTDVFYFLEGSATFVTGGTMSGGKDTAPGEIRGSSMDGGVVHQVVKGDVVIVPANVTHWFKEVQQPITYFGVKVR
jgi:mannose-6-phosphate isomerase-like protein (cupin superfamily)